MDRCREVTAAYYSKWLGQDGILNHDLKGIWYVHSEERNLVQRGYGEPFDIYVLCQENRVVVSYGNKAEVRLGALKDSTCHRWHPKEMKRALEQTFGTQASHSMKYVYGSGAEDSSPAKVMLPEDYACYEDFFRNCHPGYKSDMEWLREYFDEIQKKHMCVGVFAEGRLVSCTDGPDMPYMVADVQEIGIHTLPAYRGRGYAAAACSKCISEVLKAGKVPLWSTSVYNMASRRLAEKIGFREFAEVITMTL